MLPLINKFVGALESEGVDYCHWKSNLFVPLAAQGDDDLDLLIGHAGRQRFLEILHRLGFKEAQSPRGRVPIPGILSYHGYDEAESKLVHVHAHYKLVLGHDMTKNYHLPLENEFLRASRRGEFFRIPPPEFEWIVFVIRMTIKYSVWYSVFGGRGGLSGRERQELEHFQRTVSRGDVAGLLAEQLPFMDMDLLDDCVRSLRPGCPPRARSRAGRRIQKAMGGCSIRPRAVDMWLQIRRRLSIAGKQRLLGKVTRKTMKNGGILLALVGGDGAGKTTVLDELSRWLSPRYETTKVHMGKPCWSLGTRLVRGLLKVGRILRLWPYSRADIEFRDGESPLVFPGYPELIRAVCTARDRYLSYLRARRSADKGIFVVCDRFPLPGRISMDGPLVEWMTGAVPRKRFIRFLDRLEKRYYRSILPPDLLFVLRADPETAVERKTDESAASVRARSREIWEKDWKGVPAHVIDANRPIEDVLKEAKTVLWRNL